MAKAKAAAKLYTLTEVAKKTNISMPTLQRYKKLYQARIPSEGQGRSQRYPEEALAVFRQLKKENIGRRGRPRKNAAARPAATAKPAAKAGRKPAAKKPAAKPTEGLLTLTQIGQMTGISYPTLLRYVKTHIAKIPHKGSGRARRYQPEAVAIFKDLRSKSKRGRKPKKAMAAPAKKAMTAKKAMAAKKAKPAARRGRPPKVVDAGEIAARLQAAEKTITRLTRELERVKKKLGKPIKIVWR